MHTPTDCTCAGEAAPWALDNVLIDKVCFGILHKVIRCHGTIDCWYIRGIPNDLYNYRRTSSFVATWPDRTHRWRAHSLTAGGGPDRIRVEHDYWPSGETVKAKRRK